MATIYRLINESDIPVRRIGERYRFSRRKLLEWIEK
jgi:excisionase family DNA binding protein